MHIRESGINRTSKAMYCQKGSRKRSSVSLGRKSHKADERGLVSEVKGRLGRCTD